MNALWQLLENQTVHSINELFLFPFLRGCPILAPQHTLYIGKMSLTRLMWEALLLFPPTTILSHNQMLLSYDHSILFTLLLSFFFFLRWIWFWVRTLFFFPLSNGAFFFFFFNYHINWTFWFRVISFRPNCDFSLYYYHWSLNDELSQEPI